jgi:hypothetical protein
LQWNREAHGTAIMGGRNGRYALRMLAAVFAAGTLTLALPAPASAEGIFEFFFGGLRRSLEPQRPVSAYAEPSAEPYSGPQMTQPRERIAETAPRSAYCVRTCDGHYFPVRAQGNVSAADMCRAFCPGSKTRLYSGGGIDHAVAPDGSRYADLDAAFLYRQNLVAGCTCNGHDAFGLAHVDVATDPTLRPGDIVATQHGLMAFTGKTKGKVADFTPVESDRGLAKSYRDKLSELKIMPPNPGARMETPVTLPLAADASRRDERHRAQLAR